MKEEIEKQINELYTEFENDKPTGFANLSEQSYNNGFYQGRLTAMEKICQKLLNKSGDDIKG